MMKFKISFWLAQESPLRLSEPIEVIVADLERYIPEYMRE